MKVFQIFLIALVAFGCADKSKTETVNYELEIIDQDFAKATELASAQNKLLFIDFYTTWCAPCEQLDKLVFQNDSIKQILAKDFILLKYDAENDTIFHLSKKHHVSSYPTAIVLNRKGYVVNRKYGFPGNDFETLSEMVLDFTDQSIDLNNENKYLKGYSNTIDETKYPKFYIDYVNRTNTKPKTSDIVDFINSKQNFFNEEDFTTLFYFGHNAPSNIGDIILENKQKYFDLYGEQDVEILLWFLTSAKFKEAISENNDEKYDNAVAFTKRALSQGWVDDILPSREIDRLKAQNKWGDVFKLYEERKNKGDIDEGEINYVCWDVYKNCDDQQVIAKCIEWMEEVTDKNPEFTYLNTYAFLLYKSGNKKETKEAAEKALEAAKQEGGNAKTLEELMKKL
ncbi:thioredoxin family protein [Belliella marina]|uniref:Thioredoxin family protein n=1 Tax=Belliella marina TaxID=1644146 RepID=A0ABW4VL67_9BACT